MNYLPVYRALFIILFPVALLFGLSGIFMLLTFNGLFLLSASFVFTVCGYVIITYLFCQNMRRQLPMKKKLKQGIQLTALVSLLFVFFSLRSLVAMPHAEMINVGIQKFREINKDNTQQILDSQLRQIFTLGISIVWVCYIVLFYHIFCTFSLLKKYTVLFS